MNRLTNAQLISLMLIGDAFSLFCLAGDISLMTAVGFLAGCLIQLFMALPLADMYSDGKDISHSSKAVRLILLLFVLLWGGRLFNVLWHTNSVIYIPYENNGILGRLAVAAIIAAVCVYISSSGIKALARSGVIAAALGAVCTAIVVVSAFTHSDMINLLLPHENNFFGEIMRGFSLSGGLGGFTVLLSFTKGEKIGTVVKYFNAKAVLSVTVILTAVLVTGGIMDITDFPAALAAQLSQPFPVQRIDSLFLIVFAVFAVYSIAVQASAAEYLIGSTIPQMKKFRCTASLIIMAAASFITEGEYAEMLFAAASAAGLLIVPAEAFLKRRVRIKSEA